MASVRPTGPAPATITSQEATLPGNGVPLPLASAKCSTTDGTVMFIDIASIEQRRQPLLHLIRDIERQSLDRGGRVHAARGHPDAAIDDEQVLHVMATAPRIHHR